MSQNTDRPTQPIVSCEWLTDHLNDSDLRILDASWHLPAAKRNARMEFSQKRIPTAMYFDIDANSMPSALPHMLPDASRFAHTVGSMGISADNTIVVYDSVGLFSAARVWWMFRHFGAKAVYVLDGGLPAWKRSGGALQSDISNAEAGVPDLHAPSEFLIGNTAAKRQQELVDASAVAAAIGDSETLIIDARSNARFTAEEKEVRVGLRSGHIPNSVNLPFTQVLNEHGCLKSVEELLVLFDSLGLAKRRRVITTCGSGVTAAVLCLALDSAGYESVALYDGSWSEWGALDDMPVATG